MPLTVLRGSPEKPCAGFSPGKHLRDFGQLRPADRNQSVGDPGGGLRSAIRAAALGRLTFSILVPFPPWRRWQRRINALPTHGGRCRLRIIAGALHQVAGPFRQVPSRKGCRPAARPIMRPPFAVAAGRAAGLVERRGGWRPGQSSPRPGRAGCRRSLAFPVGKIGGAAALLRRSEGRLRAGGRLGHIGRENRLAGGLLRRPMPPGSEAGKRADAERASAPIPSAPRFDLLGHLTGLTPARLTPRKERPGRIQPGLLLTDFS